MISRLWDYIQTEPGFYVALFLAIWLSAWVGNGLKLSQFDLVQLRELFVFILTKYVTDSGLNSQIGKPLKEAKCREQNAT